MDGFSFSATLSASFGFRSGASTAMRLAYPLTFEGRGSALKFCPFGLGLAALAGDSPAEGDEGLFKI
jgi:hypothetical protein